MASKVSDPEYVTRILDEVEGKAEPDEG